MKRYIAAAYTNTSISDPEVCDGIQERVDAFLRRCQEARGQAIDFYVNTIAIVTVHKVEKLTKFRTFCIALQWTALHSIYSILTGRNQLRGGTST